MKIDIRHSGKEPYHCCGPIAIDHDQVYSSISLPIGSSASSTHHPVRRYLQNLSLAPSLNTKCFAESPSQKELKPARRSIGLHEPSHRSHSFACSTYAASTTPWSCCPHRCRADGVILLCHGGRRGLLNHLG